MGKKINHKCLSCIHCSKPELSKEERRKYIVKCDLGYRVKGKATDEIPLENQFSNCSDFSRRYKNN